ncbi:hypothetical protein [Ralstonia flaminis]|jgi:hypothetical protein|uniref:Uncharacterized protein n=1 Tax=Ralstonia flaminis TaxID=3058597 RepID=A0ABN9JI60_9RALS|nr:hypothetical protein [Ralstonia sp. LMG 18101]CAJ0812917.1 hypothetical protein LMG18101_01732 [Ralstonia sp. LMG 18101]
MRTPLLATVLLALTLPSTAAPAFILTVKNETQNCTWITIYQSYSIRPWEIQHARFVRPNAIERFSISDNADLRVRAEVKDSAQCGNTPNIADVHDWRKDPPFPREKPFSARVVKTGDGRFHLWIHN